MRTTKIFMSIAALLTLNACSSIRNYMSPDEENLLSGAGSILVNTSSKKAKDFELIDIDELKETYELNDPTVVSDHISVNDDDYTYRRNDLQDRLIASSNQRCGAYLRVLTSSKSQTHMGWGGLATFLSGAATVTTPAAAAKVLAAGSTVSNAYLSMYNEAYFSNLTINVISSGISKHREGILQHITPERAKPLSGYSVNRAIADALVYHSACNIITGIETAATATNKAEPKDVAPSLK